MGGLKDLIGIEEGDVVSIVGSGGKTTLIYKLAKELKKNKVMVATTTKMFCPNYKDVDNVIYLHNNNTVKVKEGVTFLGDSIVQENKIHTEPKQISDNIKLFNYTLVESDGSKRKPLKGWNDTEPLIIKETTKTIGVIPLNILGKRITEQNIHRVDKFIKITGAKLDDEITIDVLANVILHPNGLFKDSIGEKILFLNRIESKYHINMAQNLLKILEGECNDIDKIIGGDLENNNYFNFKSRGDL